MPAPNIKNALKSTIGGWFSDAIYSGAAVPGLNACYNGAFAVGSDVMLWSGAGRLDAVVPHLGSLHSGTVLSIRFYDAGAPVSGGPLYASGHRPIWDSPVYLAPLSGGGGILSSGQLPVVPDISDPFWVSQPFASGLCFNCKSGQGGFTVFFTPETQGQ